MFTYMHIHNEFGISVPDKPKHQRHEEVNPKMEIEPAVQLGVTPIIFGRHKEIYTAKHP